MNLWLDNPNRFDKNMAPYTIRKILQIIEERKTSTAFASCHIKQLSKSNNVRHST